MTTVIGKPAPGERPMGAVAMTTGIVLIILGCLAVALAQVATLATVLMFGLILVAAGLTQFVHAFWYQGVGQKMLHLGIAVLTVVTGAVVLAHPGLGAASLTLLIGMFLIAAGIFRMVISLQFRGHGWGWLLFSGIITLVLGILIANGWPQTAAWVIGIFIGIDLITAGWWLVLLGMAARRLTA